MSELLPARPLMVLPRHRALLEKGIHKDNVVDILMRSRQSMLEENLDLLQMIFELGQEHIVCGQENGSYKEGIALCRAFYVGSFASYWALSLSATGPIPVALPETARYCFEGSAYLSSRFAMAGDENLVAVLDHIKAIPRGQTEISDAAQNLAIDHGGAMVSYLLNDSITRFN